MDKKPVSTTPTDTRTTVDSATPRVTASPPREAVPMPAYSPVGGAVPRQPVPMPSGGRGSVPAAVQAAATPAEILMRATVARLAPMEGYPSNCGGMQARAMVATDAVAVTKTAGRVIVAQIGDQPPARRSTGG